MTTERRKSGRFFRKVGRKKSTYERSRASLSSSSSTRPSATSPPPDVNPSASSAAAASSVVAEMEAQARPLTIAEPTSSTPTSSSSTPVLANDCRDQSSNVSPRAKGKGKGRMGEQEEERGKNPAKVLGDGARGENPHQVLGGLDGNKNAADHVLGGESSAGDDALLMIRGRTRMRRMESDREREILRRLSDWAAERLQLESVERENERKKRGKWEMDRLERDKAAREADREERAKEREERAKEMDERAKERDERAKERDEREKERDERAKERADRAIQRTKEMDERAKERNERAKEMDERAKERNERAKERDEREKEREERAKEREERAKEREERAKEREEARSMAALNTVDNLSSGMVGASATLVTSLLGLNPRGAGGRLLRLSLGIAGASVLGLNAVVLGGIGSGLHGRVSPDTFGSLTLTLRIIVGAVVLFIAIAVNFLHSYL